MKILIRLAACVASVWCVSELLPRHAGYSSWAALLLLGAVMCLLYLFLRPVLQVLSIPFSLITFGLFTFVVNAGVIKRAAALVPGAYLHGFWTCVLTALLISLVDVLLRRCTRTE